MTESVHKSVLLKETIEGLFAPSKVEGNEHPVVIDCTLGGGGHSQEIFKRYPGAEVIALDQDQGAWERAKESFKDKNIIFINKNFRELNHLDSIGLVDGIIFDLGLSSDQLENSGRGFSFIRNEPLLMTMKENPSSEDLTAREIINTWEEKNLADIIYGWGEERYAKRIARAIVERRGREEIGSTMDLVETIASAVPLFYKRGRIHFATRTFQALRIAVNDELRALEEGLAGAFEKLKPGGRMAIISFHSLEDRVVKRFSKQKVKEGLAIYPPAGGKKPITPTVEEIKNNLRSRSAKLRILQKIN